MKGFGRVLICYLSGFCEFFSSKFEFWCWINRRVFDLLISSSGLCEILSFNAKILSSDVESIWGFWRVLRIWFWFNCRVLVGFWFTDVSVWNFEFWQGNLWWVYLIMLDCFSFDWSVFLPRLCGSCRLKIWIFWTWSDIMSVDSPFWCFFFGYDCLVTLLCPDFSPLTMKVMLFYGHCHETERYVTRYCRSLVWSINLIVLVFEGSYDIDFRFALLFYKYLAFKVMIMTSGFTGFDFDDLLSHSS